MLHNVHQPVTNSPCLLFVAMQVVCSRLVLEIFSAEKTLENDTAVTTCYITHHHNTQCSIKDII